MMPALLPPLRLTGARVLRDGELQARSIALAEGKITRGPFPEVDLSGYLVLPGIIDLHNRGFERHLAGRPLLAGLAMFDRDIATQGVTTCFLSQGWSWEGGPHSPDQAEALMIALKAYRPAAEADLRLQIRAETHLVAETQRLIAAVKRHDISYVSFSDHLDEGFHMARMAPAAFAAWARSLSKTPQDLTALIESTRADARLVPRSLCTLAEAFDDLGTIYASHDDPDGETRERYSMIGARIAEFPLTRHAAAAAHAMMCPVIMPAAGLLPGAPDRTGSASALSLVADGLCDVLASQDTTPLAKAAFALVDRGLMDLPKAWDMISANPAEILRLFDRGNLQPGLRADLVIVNAETRTVEATIAAGRITHLAGEAAARFLQQAQVGRLAAE